MRLRKGPGVSLPFAGVDDSELERDGFSDN